MIRHSPMAKLVVLSAVHFCVDFYAGVIVPLPEPTLTRHLGVGLPVVTLIIGCTAFLVNLVQPLGGWLLPKRGLPFILLIAPPLAALAAAIGLTHSIAVTTGLLAVSSIAIGIVHHDHSKILEVFRVEDIGVRRVVDGLSGKFIQRGLGVEALHMAYAAAHEQPDHTLGFGLEMRLAIWLFVFFRCNDSPQR